MIIVALAAGGWEVRVVSVWSVHRNGKRRMIPIPVSGSGVECVSGQLALGEILGSVVQVSMLE